MFSFHQFASLVVALLPALTSVAVEPETQAQEKQSRWSLGVGVQLGQYIQGKSQPQPSCIGGLACLAASDSKQGWDSDPQMSLVVERTLGPKMSLMLHASVLFTEWDSSFHLEYMRQHQRTTDVGVGAGLRYNFNPGGLVEFSTYLDLQGHWLHEQFEYKSLSDSVTTWRSQVDQDGYQIHANIGLVLEHKLTDWLHLRLESKLFQLGYAHSDGVETYQDTDLLDNDRRKSTTNGLLCRLHLEPSLMLRALF